ncbi:hypothetical protein PPERSA_05343 [Pseudocohnilembus persalinus]|uniref:Insulin-like growth factor binding protein, N-terminal n=1 Tax=Pseudocohnilembus persalinus TaxID=266149 RepID=A0A0V0R620_PSEPJ|nr:hypothetical protein PPERSA_05343 [Pseudocohnilembus persalinus]|eukprot:KRX09951.1 hypothetical protein PPERSA_05343 [Pseudocohnilembus persalinus]
MGDRIFKYLEFGVINEDYMWIKCDGFNQSRKNVIFFANPLDCQVYRSLTDNSIYLYQFENIGLSHIFHTYHNNKTASILVSSSFINGNEFENLQAVRIDTKNCHEDCKTCYNYDTCLSCYGDMGLNNENQCQCLENSIHAYEYKGQCKVCQNFNLNYTLEGYWSKGDCFENYYLPDIIQHINNKCKIKLNSDYFYCRDQKDSKIITSLNQDGEFISCSQDCFPCNNNDTHFKLFYDTKNVIEIQ